jgi:hypothetical protein
MLSDASAKRRYKPYILNAKALQKLSLIISEPNLILYINISALLRRQHTTRHKADDIHKAAICWLSQKYVCFSRNATKNAFLSYP